MKKLILFIVPFFTFGQVDPSELCDSISISFIEYNAEEQYIEIEFSTQFLTQYWYSYAGFTMTNNLGEIIATETLENVGNVYGIGNNMTETRFLQITENFITPLGNLNLVNDLFSGANPESVCSWPLYDKNLYTYVPDDNFEQNKEKIVIKIIDLLGRENNIHDCHIKIYNDGSIEKVYLKK